MNQTQRQARFCGFLYLLIGITAPISLIYVPSKLFVSGDAAATADRIRASESLLRIGIACELFHQVVVIFLVLAMYRLFKPVHEGLTRHLVVLGALVSVPVMFANVLNEVAAMILVSAPEYLSVFDPAQLDALAYLFIRLHAEGVDVTSIFWGLWLFPLGLLVIRSRFIPWILGVLLIIAGTGYLASAVTSLLLPQYTREVSRVAIILEMGELPIMFWLLIWGARVKPSEAPAS